MKKLGTNYIMTEDERCRDLWDLWFISRRIQAYECVGKFVGALGGEDEKYQLAQSVIEALTDAREDNEFVYREVLKMYDFELRYMKKFIRKYESEHKEA